MNFEDHFKALPEPAFNELRKMLELLSYNQLKTISNRCRKLLNKTRSMASTILDNSVQIERPLPSTSQHKIPVTPWFRGIPSNQFIAMYVTGIMPKNRRLTLPATITLVAFDRSISFRKVIFHRTGSFNPLSNITGLKEHSLVNGENMVKVLYNLRKAIFGKVLICCGARELLRICGLRPEKHNFKVFDLQWHYYRELNNQRYGHSLRTLIFNLLGEPIHPGVIPEAENAMSIMRIFTHYMHTIETDPTFLYTRDTYYNTIKPYNDLKIVPKNKF